MKTHNKKQAKVTFTFDDVSELYHIVCNRGFCSTRAKLLNALRELDADLAKRIDDNDDLAFGRTEPEQIETVRCPDHRNGGATRCPRGGAELQIWQRRQWGD